MKLKAAVIFSTVILLLLPAALVLADQGSPVMTREEFDTWPDLPEYTIFNPFPSKGSNCTWYAHGRMMQLGYCPKALDSMRFSAYRWADDAAKGAEVVKEPEIGVIAFWDNKASFGGSLGHVGVVEKIEADGSILISDSSSSRSAYNLITTAPGDRKWPTAFIKVPEGPQRSVKFKPYETVRTTAVNLYFRLEGVNRDPVLVPKGTEALIKAHPSNGIYAAQARTTSSYHYWWYAAVKVDGDIKKGWLAETYLEWIAAGEPVPERDNPEPEDEPGDEPEGEPEDESGEEPDDNPADESEDKPQDETEDKPEDKPEDDSENEPENGSEQNDLEDDPDEKQKEEEDPDPEDNPKSEEDEITETELIAGDVNGDGKIDVRDVTLVMQHILKIISLSEQQLSAADLNQDQVIDVLDVVLIMQDALGLKQ